MLKGYKDISHTEQVLKESTYNRFPTQQQIHQNHNCVSEQRQFSNTRSRIFRIEYS
jgi:hypothetical protein